MVGGELLCRIALRIDRDEQHMHLVAVGSEFLKKP
jgi:hypothetical protein